MIQTAVILVGYCLLIALHPYFGAGAVVLHVSILAYAARKKRPK